MNCDDAIGDGYRLVVNRRQLAALFRVTETTVRAWMQETPALPSMASGRHGVENQHDVSEALIWWTARAERKALAGSAKDRYYLIKAKREELAFRRDEGELCIAADVTRELSKAVVATRARLLQIPETVAGAMDTVTGYEARRDVLREEIERALVELSTYPTQRNDPDHG